jgi:hypothetical protein
MPHRHPNRRGFLGTVGALPVLGMAAELTTATTTTTCSAVVPMRPWR